jgi:hypothetical protein
MPDALLLVGAAIIVAAGIFILRREQLQPVKSDAPMPPPGA